MKEYKYKFSVIIPVYNVEDYLEETIESVLVQSIGFEENIQLILVNDGSPDNSGEICEKYQRLYPDNVKYIVKENGGVSSARNAGIKHIEGKYVNFLDSDDKWGTKVFENAYNFFEEHYDEVDVVCGRIKFFEAKHHWHPLDYKFRNKGTRVADLTSEDEYDSILLHVSSVFIKSESLTETDKFQETVKYGEDLLFINLIILRKMKYGILSDSIYYYRSRMNQSSAMQNNKVDVEYYTTSPNKYYDGMINASIENYGEVTPYVQSIIAYDVGWRVGNQPPEEIRGDEKLFSDYTTLLQQKLAFVDDRFILKSKVHKNIAKKEALMLLKNHGDFYGLTNYNHETETIYYKDIPLIWLKENHGCCHVNLCEIVPGKKKNSFNLKIEGLVAKWLFRCCPESEKKFVIRVGKKRVPIELKEYPFANEVNFFNSGKRYYCFQAEIPFEKQLNDDNEVKVRLALQIGDNIVNMSVKYGKFVPNRRDFAPVYKIYGKYIVSCNRKIITITRPKNMKYEHFKRELKCLKWLASKKLWFYILIRLKCIRFRKSLKGKKIWLISDRFEKAGDNGEVFFKYISSAAVNKNILPVFVISKNSSDAERLKSVGQVIYLEDKNYLLYFLCADKVISSSGSDFAFNPLTKEQRKYLTDLFSGKLIFLQHGITYNDLSAWLHKFNKNIDKFITSAKMEYDSIAGGDYLYSQKEVKLTGFARYDLLENNRQKLVAIIPTWRKTIKESYDKNTQSVYYDGFKDTEYFKFYNNLINDEKLLNIMREKGYKGIFCLHPIHAEQHIDYQSNDVFSVNAGYVDYPKVFSEAALLVTDYSSIFFDFSYLKKPVIYSQFDKDEFFEGQVFDTGYFDYATDGFGPVCCDYESAVQAVIKAIENDCVNQPEYVERIEQFYAYNDRNNCKRIYEVIK